MSDARRRTAAVLLALMVASVPVESAVAGEDSVPSAKRVAKVAVKDHGPEGIAFTLLAVDRGYSPRQVVDGVLDHALEPTGEIVGDDGASIAPAGAATGFITDVPASADAPTDDELEPPISNETVREALPERDRAARELYVLTILAAARGYSIEDLLIDGLLEDGFVPFGAGLIIGLPVPEPPEPDFLDELLVGVEQKEPASSDTKGDSSDARFVGELVMEGPWGDLFTPVGVVSESRIQLRVKGDRIVGKYSVQLDFPQTGGICAGFTTFQGTVDLTSDGPGFSGVAVGTQDLVSNGRENCPGTTTIDAYWNTTVVRTSDDRLSGTMDWQAHSGLQFTFEAAAG